MELICPECLGALAIQNGDKVRCTVHGGQYQVLYLRQAVPPPLPAQAMGNDADMLAVGALGTCRQHASAAVVRCAKCETPVCATCAFPQPDARSLCPDCATTVGSKMSSGRKRLLIWSYGLAIWSTLVLVALISGVLADAVRDEIGAIIGSIMLISVLLGTALSFASLERRLSNPVSVWASLIWNSVLLTICLLLAVVGTFAG